jgi:isochorismate pyruvate lyase
MTEPASAPATPREPAVDGGPVRRFVDPSVQPLAATLGDLRARIDALDAEIVERLAERGRLVRDATRFKRDPHQVNAEARQQAVFARVRALAERAAPDLPGLPDVVEAGYRVLVGGFVAGEQRLFAETVPIDDAPRSRPTSPPAPDPAP